MAVVATTTAVAVVTAWLVESPWLLLAEALTIGVMGASFGLTWEERPERRRAAAVTWATRALVGAVLLTGLPPAMGPWSMAVMGVLGLTHPGLVQAAVRRAGRRGQVADGDPGALTDEELARRWRSSSVAVRSSWRTPAEVLAVVQERQRLLEELERRDPQGFSLWLVSSGWRRAHGR